MSLPRDHSLCFGSLTFSSAVQNSFQRMFSKDTLPFKNHMCTEASLPYLVTLHLLVAFVAHVATNTGSLSHSLLVSALQIFITTKFMRLPSIFHVTKRIFFQMSFMTEAFKKHN